jgi:hypothetical protein
MPMQWKRVDNYINSVDTNDGLSVSSGVLNLNIVSSTRAGGISASMYQNTVLGIRGYQISMMSQYSSFADFLRAKLPQGSGIYPWLVLGTDLYTGGGGTISWWSDFPIRRVDYIYSVLVIPVSIYHIVQVLGIGKDTSASTPSLCVRVLYISGSGVATWQSPKWYLTNLT